jgi:hypothetical protein
MPITKTCKLSRAPNRCVEGLRVFVWVIHLIQIRISSHRFPLLCKPQARLVTPDFCSPTMGITGACLCRNSKA